MAIDATVGGSASNSYVTAAEADTYFEGRLNPEGYTTATVDIQERALRTATIYLDGRVNWVGHIKDPTTPQALDWPRIDGVDPLTANDILSGVIPLDLKNAQCEFALYLLDTGEPEETNTLDAIKVGSLTIDFNEFKSNQLIPDIVWSMISYLGYRFTPKDQLKSVSICR